MRSITPSAKSIFPSSIIPSKRNEIPIIMRISFLITDFETMIRLITSEIPKMAPTFTMLLYTTFPNATSDSPCSAEEILIANSGVEVPSATTVKPITG